MQIIKPIDQKNRVYGWSIIFDYLGNGYGWQPDSTRPFKIASISWNVWLKL